MSTEGQSMSEFGALRFDPRDRTLCCYGKQARLSAREFELLMMLARNAGQVVSYQRLNRKVWGETWTPKSPGQRLTILRLRRKLLAMRIDEVRITNFAGRGYRLQVINGLSMGDAHLQFNGPSEALIPSSIGT